MKYNVFKTLVLTFATQLIFAQEKASVEKSIFGVQTGTFGIWVHNETKLTNQVSLRSEIGLDLGTLIDDSSNTYILIPTIRLEPRWYYNLEKRVRKGKNISKNSGNFLALNTRYNPDAHISDKNNINVVSTLSFIPKWGIKRTILKHLTYEIAYGLGPFIILKGPDLKQDIADDLHVRIGYTF